jgi:hypothetical protein
MPLVTTPGAPDANSYASVAEADAYNAARPFGTAWAALTQAQKEGALQYALLLLDASFQWTGQATGAVAVGTQAAPTPRDVFMYQYRYSDKNTTPPGSGQFQINGDNVYPYVGVTTIEFHILTDDGVDIRTWLSSFPIGTIIYAQDQNDGTRFVRFQTTAVGVETVQLAVTILSIGAFGLINNQACEIAFIMQDPDGGGPGPGPGEPNPKQVLCWPRVGMFTRNGTPIDSMVLPFELRAAQCEYARQAATTDLTADNEAAKQGLKSVKAGSVAVEFHPRDAATGIAMASSDYAYLGASVPAAVRILLVPSWYTQQRPLLAALGARSGFVFEAQR